MDKYLAGTEKEVTEKQRASMVQERLKGSSVQDENFITSIF